MITAGRRGEREGRGRVEGGMKGGEGGRGEDRREEGGRMEGQEEEGGRGEE